MPLKTRQFQLFIGMLLLSLGSSYLPGCSPGGPPASPTATPVATQAPAATRAPASTQAPAATRGSASVPAPSATAAPKALVNLTAAQIAMLELTPERQRILESGAKAEGEMMLYTTSSGYEPIAAAFMRKYPFIKAEVFQSSTAALVERTRAEITSGRLGGDLVNGGLRSFIPLSQFVTPFTAPGANFSVHPKGAISSLSLIVFGYNNRLVAPNDVPKSLDDLLLPRWKGKIGFHGPPNTFPIMWTGMLIQVLGEEQATSFMKRLGEQNLFLYQSGGAGIQALTSGETHIGTQTQASVMEAKQSKAPLDFVALDPTAATVTLTGIFEKTQHPYSAMLFLDFLLGPEGPQVLKKEGNYLSMRDIEQGEIWGVKLPKRIRLESPEDEKSYKKWNEKFNELIAKKK